jgi:hypothetical protein
MSLPPSEIDVPGVRIELTTHGFSDQGIETSKENQYLYQIRGRDL